MPATAKQRIAAVRGAAGRHRSGILKAPLAWAPSSQVGMSALPQYPLRRHRLNVADYQRMAESGALTADARMELIEGEIIDMAPIGSKHAAVVKRLDRALQRAVGDRALVSVQDPIRLGEHSQPQPDLALLRPAADDYAGGLPSAADVLLLIEVADRSAAYDLQVKAPLYAEHGIGELWVIDLDAGTVRLMRAPRGRDYLEARVGPRPGRVAVAALDGVEIDLDPIVADLLG